MEKQKIEGAIICFDGIDGSGKSTQIKLVADYLQDKGYDVLCLRQPGIPGVGTHLRNALFDDSSINNRLHDVWAKRMIYLAEYREFVDRYRSERYKNTVILCDRSVISSNIAYGGAEIGDEVEVMKRTVPFYEDLADKAPDAIIIFEVALHKTIERLRKRSAGNYYDDKDLEFKLKCEKIYEMLGEIEEMNPDYLGLAPGSNIFRYVDASKDIPFVFSDIIEIINTMFEVRDLNESNGDR